jgi:DNA invertase Pin-like site-specific DNA recombinase
MSEPKITTTHLRRAAVVYVRQSTMAQLSRNRESTARQYDLVARATELGWPRSAVRVIDDDLGVSAAAATGRTGFAELAAQVGLGQVGIVLALEVSRLARNNADWYRLLDLAGMTDTLIADTDGIYHPGLFNDRMLLGMRGTMSEAELHILAPASTAGSAARPPAASCVADCRSGWSGATLTAKSVGIPTRPSPVSSLRSSSGSRCVGRCAGCGCGCASKS